MAAELMIIDLIISGLGKEMLFMANTAFCELIQVLSFIMQAYKDNFFLFSCDFLPSLFHFLSN